MDENSKNESKNKKRAIFEIIKIAVSVLAGIFGGGLLQNLYINSQVVDVSGDDNTITINSVDDLIKNFNKLSEENETLKEQNKDYFEQSKEAKSTVENLEKQLGDTPSIELKDLGLCIDGEDINMNKSNSCAIIDGANYFSEEFIHCLISDTTSVKIKEDTMFLGKIIAEKDSLFSQKIIDSHAFNVDDNIKDSYQNVHSNAVRLQRESSVVYNLENKYSFLRLKIAVEESSRKGAESVITISADDKIVYTSPTLNKIDTKEIECNDININNCSRLEIKCSNDVYIYPIIYDAEVYN